MNNEILEKNLKSMEKWYPDFAKMIREENYEKDELEIIGETSWDGELIYKVKKDGHELYLNGKRNAKMPLDIWRERLGEIHKYAPIILIGLGSGLYLKKLIQSTESTVNVMMYEPSMTLFLKTLSEVDLSEEIEDRPIGFVVDGLNGTELEPVMAGLISLENIEFLKEEVHPNYQKLYPEQVLNVLKRLNKRTDSIIINENTGVRFSGYLAKNQMLNMRYVCDGYNTKKLCKAVPHDIPAILVSAGPSLNKNVKELKAAKNKAFILAVDTAVKPLLQEGIIPDAFITIDANKMMTLVDREDIRDIPVIASVTANSSILERQRGKKIFFFDTYVLPMMAYAEVGKVMPGVAIGGSVACSGLSLLYKMGFNTIILVGQDLAFTDNKSHADGTFEKVMPTENTDGMVKVKGNYEDKVPTRGDFKIYLDWFAMYISGIKKHRNVKVINATKGGAYIEGTELMELQDAIKENCTREVNLAEDIDHMESEFTEEERKKVVEFLHGIPDELEDIRKIAKDLYRNYQKIERLCKATHFNANEYLKLLKRIKKATKKCEEKTAHQLIQSTMALADYVVRSESLYDGEDIQKEGAVIAMQGKKYAEMLQKCAVILEEYAKETLLTIV